MPDASGRKTVADYIRERDQAGYNEEGIYTQMQNRYMPILREPDSFLASSVPRIFVNWYEGENPYLQPFDITPEPKMIMDEEVPPPVQQEPIEDDFLSDSEVEEDVGLIEEVSEKENKMGDEDEDMHVPSWEDEFGDELVDLPTLEEEEFDHVGDLLFLETLLAGKPTTEINTPNEEKVEEAVTKKKTKPPRHSHDCRPVPPSSRERVHFYMDRTTYHIPHIKFGPGKSRNRCSDPFGFFKRFSRFTIRFLTNNGERSELNGLDKGWIKEKPPD
jgi:hypothetical protein